MLFGSGDRHIKRGDVLIESQNSHRRQHARALCRLHLRDEYDRYERQRLCSSGDAAGGGESWRRGRHRSPAAEPEGCLSAGSGGARPVPTGASVCGSAQAEASIGSAVSGIGDTSGAQPPQGNRGDSSRRFRQGRPRQAGSATPLGGGSPGGGGCGGRSRRVRGRGRRRA